MIRRSTIVYVILLLILVGAYFYLKNRAKATDTATTATATPSAEVVYLFPAEQGTPSSIRVDAKSGKLVKVARGADKAWMVTEPLRAVADQGSAEAAASQVTTMRVLDSVPNVDPKVVGLEVPEYVLTVKFTSGVEQTVNVGIVTPTQNGYYARDAAGKIVIVSKDSVDALLGLLENPPYAATSTPPAAATTPEAVTPPSGATATPQP